MLWRIITTPLETGLCFLTARLNSDMPCLVHIETPDLKSLLTERLSFESAGLMITGRGELAQARVIGA